MFRTKKIIYDKNNGYVYDISDGDEIFGNIKDSTFERLILKEKFNNIDKDMLLMVEFEHDYKQEEFNNMGSCKINLETKDVIIYPKLTITTDKSQILSDNIDFATITSDYAEQFKVDDGEWYTLPYVEFSSEILGTHIIYGKSELNGINSVIVEVI